MEDPSVLKIPGKTPGTLKLRDFGIAIVLLLLATLAGCCRLYLYDGDYTGRVVDADTGKPIEGVAVLGVWYSIAPTVGGAHHSFDDARETVTDANGRFTIPGQGLRVLSCLVAMDATVFKSGYECLRIKWDLLKEGGYRRFKDIRWEGDAPVLPLRKLTLPERKDQYVPLPPSEMNWENFPRYMEEHNRDRIERGRQPCFMKRDRLDDDFL